MTTFPIGTLILKVEGYTLYNIHIQIGNNFYQILLTFEAVYSKITLNMNYISI